MQTYTLQIEDSAVEKFMWVLEHFKDVVKINQSKTLEDELLEDLEQYKNGTLKTTAINDISSHIARLRN